jgi:hypothetical protein
MLELLEMWSEVLASGHDFGTPLRVPHFTTTLLWDINHCTAAHTNVWHAIMPASCTTQLARSQEYWGYLAVGCLNTSIP